MALLPLPQPENAISVLRIAWRLAVVLMTGPMAAGIGGVLSASNNQSNFRLFAGSTSS